MAWIASVSGKAVDLISPTVEQVDFPDIAWSLAHTNRYGGNGFTQVSVGHHTLIGLDICPEALRPWWLIHDAHEQRTGDTMRPVAIALAAIEREIFPGEAARCERVMRALRARHDAVIHAAAGLPLPNATQAAALARIDVRCIAIEHRDFHRDCERPWAHELAGIEAGRGTVRRYLPPDQVADQLAARFCRYLPGLQAEAGI